MSGWCGNRLETTLDAAYDHWLNCGVCWRRFADDCIFWFTGLGGLVPKSTQRKRRRCRIGDGVFVELIGVANWKEGGYEPSVGREGR